MKSHFVSRSVTLLTGLIVLILSAGKTASANTIVLGTWGSLQYTETHTSTPCSPPKRSPLYLTYTYTAFVYVDFNGVSHSISGTAKAIQLVGGSTGCPQAAVFPINLVSNGLTIPFVPTTTGGASAVVQPVQGVLSPKYVILGVTYAPPGPQSSVTYSTSDLVGTTTSLTNTFSNSTNVSISVSAGIDAWGNGGMITGTESTTYSQASGNSLSVTASKASTESNKTTGTGNAFSPVDHDYDIIWLWLNPLVVFSFTTGPTVLQWNGYAYDPADPAVAMDVYPVSVGYLNGHFGPNVSVANVLARSWATDEVWPAGNGPGLTAADESTILGADPFSNSSYTFTLAPGVNPPTTVDGRFELAGSTLSPTTFDYVQCEPGGGDCLTQTYTNTYQNTTTTGQQTSRTVQQEFALEEDASTSFFAASVKVVIKDSSTLTWTSTWQSTITNTSTQTDELTIASPPCSGDPCNPSYAGPGEFDVYTDNLYGTFVFIPVN
jgi:hypothetical protein